MNKSLSQKKEERPKGQGLGSLLKPYRGMIFLLLLLALFSNGINLLLPKIIARGIDAATAGELNLPRMIREFLLASLAVFLFAYLQSIVQTYVSERVARDLRTRLADQISRQSHGFLQQANPGRLLTNLTADVDSIKMFVSQAVVSIASSLIIIIGASILLLSINWKLGLVVIAVIPIIGIAFFIVLRKVRALFKKSREVIDWLNGVINESVLGSAMIRVINSQQLSYNKFLDASGKGLELGLSILRLFATLIPVITFTASMAYLATLSLGGHFVMTGTMTIGNISAFNNYISMLIFPILIIGFMSNVIAQATASYQRIGGILNAPPPVETGTRNEELRGAIRLDRVTVSYGEKMALKDLSFSIEPGSKTAIIGPTAAGKTQLLYLLTALIKPSAGSVEFDGHPLDSYEKEGFHRQVGFVFQDSIIFNMSIRENIAFSDTVTDESLEKAIQTAELADFIDSLPERLDTIVSERGTSLSGGQKQRIMLARALAINPSILLLDDFTARVDTRTEQKILDNVRKNYPGITLLSVTQKIDSIVDYDRIILLMEGEMIAAGRHEELMKSCPEYVQIFQSQRSTSHYEQHELQS
ncbi:MAG: ABC transporter ATP-binding protein [Puia sp.]|nr:ABC transporter ATP-binding protein [Puia sp.]